MKLQKNQKKLESEYENVVIELQNEIAQLKKEINRKQSRNEKEDQAKYLMAQELKEHNEYLSDKLQKVIKPLYYMRLVIRCYKLL